LLQLCGRGPYTGSRTVSASEFRRGLGSIDQCFTTNNLITENKNSDSNIEQHHATTNILYPAEEDSKNARSRKKEKANCRRKDLL